MLLFRLSRLFRRSPVPSAPSQGRRLRPRALAYGVATLGCAFFAGACVDLFHSTNFETLCDTSPTDPQCAKDVGTGEGSLPDGGRQPVDFCAMSETEANAQALHACAWLGACVGPYTPGLNMLATCTLQAKLGYNCKANPDLRPTGELDAFWQCMHDVTSCAEVRACAFPGGVEDCGKGAGTGFTQCALAPANSRTSVHCVGDDGGPPRGVDTCILRGQVCASEDKTFAYCVGSQKFQCLGSPHCEDTNIVDCNGGRDTGFDCALYGATCTLGADGPACVPRTAGPSGTCGADTAITCNGTNVASTCLNGKSVRIDCQALGGSCLGGGVGKAPYEACFDPTGCAADANKCVGSSVEDCASGQSAKADCTALGLGACRTTEIGGAILASCGPPEP